ncbi:hypothetical protein Hypma_007526 [Hypsizygus marmoreus]|uniref:Uncharacterized protein n=1 Tax=Hypsizygus marmoreus TaxID=39966 RepID=A0A369JS05_HYPMA|nr:hypothetical protein Hypma_007526 [Hypsizygus marmoreus]
MVRILWVQRLNPQDSSQRLPQLSQLHEGPRPMTGNDALVPPRRLAFWQRDAPGGGCLLTGPRPTTGNDALVPPRRSLFGGDMGQEEGNFSPDPGRRQATILSFHRGAPFLVEIWARRRMSPPRRRQATMLSFHRGARFLVEIWARRRMSPHRPTTGNDALVPPRRSLFGGDMGQEEGNFSPDTSRRQATMLRSTAALAFWWRYGPGGGCLLYRTQADDRQRCCRSTAALPFWLRYGPGGGCLLTGPRPTTGNDAVVPPRRSLFGGDMGQEEGNFSPDPGRRQATILSFHRGAPFLVEIWARRRMSPHRTQADDRQRCSRSTAALAFWLRYGPGGGCLLTGPRPTTGNDALVPPRRSLFGGDMGQEEGNFSPA